jgi:hypothetical protein
MAISTSPSSLAANRHRVDPGARFYALSLLLFLFTAAPSVNASRVEVRHEGTGWRLFVDSQPYIVRGVDYSPVKVGESPDLGTLRDWMTEDDDRDGRIDAPYQSWVDKNRNDVRDPDEPEVGDFELLKEMGANTIRIYHMPTDDKQMRKLYKTQQASALHYAHAPNKKLLRDLFTRYGIRSAIGDLVGAYTVGSGASWETGTDYRDPVQRERLKHSVEVMVKSFKDEPYVLFWILGNENNLGDFTHTNAREFPDDYATLIEEIAQSIHQIDPDHPVAICSGETHNLDALAAHAPDVDIFGVNSYRNFGFGSLWTQVQNEFDRPILLTEFGTLPAPVQENRLDEDKQADSHRRAWCDIQAHTAGGGKEPANAIGGFAFEWMDEWWFSGQPREQNTSGTSGPEANNEWQGLISQGDGRHSPFLRQLRKSYFMYKGLWADGSESCSDAAAAIPAGIPWQTAPSEVEEEEQQQNAAPAPP